MRNKAEKEGTTEGRKESEMRERGREIKKEESKKKKKVHIQLDDSSSQKTAGGLPR